jgi:hypothetical protein
MSEAKARWDEVGERFGELGKRLKDRYDAKVGLADDEKAKLNDAMHQISESLDAGFTTLGDSIRDPEIRDDLKHAGTAVAEALSASFADVADELKKAVQRNK